MKKYAYFTTLTILLALFLTGCTWFANDTNENVNSVLNDNQNTNQIIAVNQNKNVNTAVNENENVNQTTDSNENINETVDQNENINNNQTSEDDNTEIDISAWNEFYFKELGFRIKLPFDKEDLSEGTRSCGPNTGCDFKGYQYAVLAKRSDHNYIIIGSNSEKWTPSRSGLISDFYNYENDGQYITVLQNYKMSYKIDPLTFFEINGRTIYIYNPIKDYFSNIDFYDISTIPKAYAAIISLSKNDKYKAALIYVEENDLSLKNLEKALKTINFD